MVISRLNEIMHVKNNEWHIVTSHILVVVVVIIYVYFCYTDLLSNYLYFCIFHHL